MNNDESSVTIEVGESNGEKSIRLAFGVGEDGKSYIFPLDNAVEIARGILEVASKSTGSKNDDEKSSLKESIQRIRGEVHTSIDIEKIDGDNEKKAVVFTIGFKDNGEKNTFKFGIPSREAIGMGNGLIKAGKFVEMLNAVQMELENFEHVKDEGLLDKIESAIRELDTGMLKKLSALLTSETNPDEVTTRKMVSVKCGIDRKGDPLICVEIANRTGDNPVRSTLIDFDYDEALSFGKRIQKCAELTKRTHDDLREIYPDITMIPKEELTAKLSELAAKYLGDETYCVLDNDPGWKRSSGVEFSDQP